MLFAFGSPQLSDKAHRTLVTAADLVRQAGAGAVHVDGYTDSIGDDASNLTLSRQRAQAVTEGLTALLGAANITVAVQGHGKSRPDRAQHHVRRRRQSRGPGAQPPRDGLVRHVAGMPGLVGATVFFVALVATMAAFLVRLGRHAHAAIPGASRATGVIVDMASRPPPGRWFPSRHGVRVPLQHPQVRFTTADGRESTFTAAFATSVKPGVGEPVEVPDDPDDPSRAQIAPGSVPASAGCARGAMWADLAVVTAFGIIGLTIAWLVSTQLTTR